MFVAYFCTFVAFRLSLYLFALIYSKQFYFSPFPYYLYLCLSLFHSLCKMTHICVCVYLHMSADDAVALLFPASQPPPLATTRKMYLDVYIMHYLHVVLVAVIVFVVLVVVVVVVVVTALNCKVGKTFFNIYFI